MNWTISSDKNIAHDRIRLTYTPEGGDEVVKNVTDRTSYPIKELPREVREFAIQLQAFLTENGVKRAGNVATASEKTKVPSSTRAQLEAWLNNKTTNGGRGRQISEVRDDNNFAIEKDSNNAFNQFNISKAAIFTHINNISDEEIDIPDNITPREAVQGVYDGRWSERKGFIISRSSILSENLCK